MKMMHSFCAFVCILILFLTGCGNRALIFTESTHNRDENYSASFKTYCAEGDGITLQIARDIFEEETAENILNSLEDDIGRITDIFGDDAVSNATVYIVSSTVDGSIYAADGEVFCTMDDINSGTYRTGLVKACLGLMEPWQSIGAEEIVFGEAENDSHLVTYYSSEDNMGVLSLFAAYFNDSFSDQETISEAYKTAASFTNFLLRQYGTETFLTCGFSESLRQEWLESIGVSTAYKPKYDLSAYEGAVYTSSEEYPLIITTSNRTFYLVPVDDLMETAGDVTNILGAYDEGMAEICNDLKETAPKNYERLMDNLDDMIYYYFDADSTYKDLLSRNVYLYDPNGILHETVHVMIPRVLSEPRAASCAGLFWQYEGIDMCLSNRATSDLFYNIQYGYLSGEYTDPGEDNMRYQELVREQYASKAALPESEQEFNYSLLFESMGIVSLKNPDLTVTWPDLAALSFADKHDMESYTEGDELTYPEAFVFTQYLVDTYGMDMVITYCLDQLSFEDAFGCSYDEAFSAMLTDLSAN